MLQRLAAVAHHRRQADVVAEQASHQAAAAAIPGQGNRHGVAQLPRCRRTTKLLGVAHGQPTEVGCALVQLPGKLPCFLPGFQMRFDLGLHKPAHTVFYRGDIFSANLSLVHSLRTHGVLRLATPIVLAMMPIITSSAPPPIEPSLPSRNRRATLFSQV